MMAQYKLDIKKDQVIQQIGDIIQDCAIRSEVFMGASQVVQDLINRGYAVDICSNSSGNDKTKELADVYRAKGPGFTYVDDIVLLPPDVSKKESYRKLSSGYNKTYVVDDSMRNIHEAAMASLQPVLITQKSKDMAIAKRDFGALVFSNVIEFWKYLVIQERR